MDYNSLERSFGCRYCFCLVEVLELSLLAFIEQSDHEFATVLKIFESSVFLLSGILAPCLEVEEGAVQLAILFVELIVIVPFLQEPLSLSFEVLLGDLGPLLLEALLLVEVLLCDVWVFPEPVFVVLLSALNLIFDVLLPAPAQPLEFALDLLLLQLLPVLLYGKFLF